MNLTKEESELKDRQNAAAKVEKRLLNFLVQFSPVYEVKVGDIQSIAMFARAVAFEEFSPKVDK